MVRSRPLAERVTVTMPSELVAGIDRIEANRSRFIAEAVRHELRRSLEAPHPLQLLNPLQDLQLDRPQFGQDLQRRAV